MAQTPYQTLQQRGPQPAQQVTAPWKQTQGPGTIQGQFQNMYNQGLVNNPYGMMATYGNNNVPVMGPKQSLGATFQDFPRATAPAGMMQSALQNHLVPNKQGFPTMGQEFTHPFAGAQVGGNPWHDPAMRKAIQSYEQLVKKDQAGGLTAAERKQLKSAEKTLQNQARAESKGKGSDQNWMQQALSRFKQSQSQGRPQAPGDAFQSVLRDMMTKMFQEQGQAGGAGA